MNTSSIKVPTWFWIVAIVMLLWNLMGVMAFIVQVTMSEEAMALLSPAEQELYSKYPMWTTIAYALAVFGGALGCVGLLMRKKWARMLFLISLVGILVQMMHSLFIAKAMDVYGPGAAIMPVMVFLIGLGLVWLSGFAIKKGWLN